MPKLNEMSLIEVKAASDKALGRNLASADSMEQTYFGDCVRNDFWWNDGACSSWLHDNKEDALAEAERIGFRKVMV